MPANRIHVAISRIRVSRRGSGNPLDIRLRDTIWIWECQCREFGVRNAREEKLLAP